MSIHRLIRVKPFAVLSAGLIAMGLSLTAMPEAQAGEFKFGITIHQPGYSVTFGDPPRHFYRAPRHKLCSPYKAIKKARGLGVRHARIHRIGSKRIVVKGRLHGKRVIAKFNRACSLRSLRRI